MYKESSFVLLFPPVNNFHRFLIHQTCEHFRNKYDLFTFSVGQGPFRRTVICFKNQLLDPHKYSDTAAAANFETRYKHTIPTQLKSWRKGNTGTTINKRDRNMGIEKNFIDTHKINTSNSGALYRPPALRNDNETIKGNVIETREIITNRTCLNHETKEATSTANTSIIPATSISCNNSPIHTNDNVTINNLTTSKQQTSTQKSQKQEQQVEHRKQPQRQQLTRRERRPDRAVYIPRARRSQTTPPNTTNTQIQSLPQQQSTQLPAQAPTTTSVTSNSLYQQLAITLDDKTTVSVDQKPSSKAHEINKISSGGAFNKSCSNNTIVTTIIKKEKFNNENKESREQRREQRSLRRLSSISTQHNKNLESNKNLNESSLSIILNNDVGDEIKPAFFVNGEQMQSSVLKNDVKNISELSDNIINFSKDFNCDSNEEFIINQEQQLNNRSAQSSEINCKSTINYTSKENKPVTSTNIIVNNRNINTMPKSAMESKSTKLNSEVIEQTELTNLRIEDVASQHLPTKCDVEERELQRASKEINRSNRRIIKQTFVTDVLQIPQLENQNNEDKAKLAEGTNKHITTQIDSNTEEEEDDDWENMYNDSGDCLDPKIMQELTSSVGKCKIELPKMDYSAYLTKQSILNEEEFPHVLEVSNFPVEFKNQDLLMVFSQYKESGFDIKWVDDTHALAVFSSSRIAAEVLTMGHPFVVLKPLAEATLESRLKAKKCSASLQPYRPRPETCAALARRLVTGALGVRLKTAAAERENEKRVLREAKERKLLAARQRDEVWES